MKASPEGAQAYNQKRLAHHPPVPLLRHFGRAFWVGGAICAVGQFFLSFFEKKGLMPDQAAIPTAAVMVVLGALMTGLGLYDRIAAYAGMGAALPITGFANSMVAPAMEFRRDGWVMGVGARLFQVAGPVFVFGTLASLLMGSLWYLFYGGFAR
ncbi:MAG: SpoVA/SpoVAEb family sporulation membrane protein [Clostridiales bacterium]|nr:SpoVA/SpoVAEb family sporulation membrane protein [Clostridiales bacterium]